MSYFSGISHFLLQKLQMSHTRDSHWYYAEIFERSLFGKKGETAVKGHICHQCGLQSKSKALWRLLVLTGFLFLLSPTPLCTQLFCYVGTIKREDCGIHSRKLRETISSEHLNELHEMSLPWKSLLPPLASFSDVRGCSRFFSLPPLSEKKPRMTSDVWESGYPPYHHGFFHILAIHTNK